MDSSGPAVSSNPLFNATASAPPSVVDKTVDSSSNTLNNKKFSDVLGKQQASDKANHSEHSASDSLNSGKSLPNVATSDAESFNVGVNVGADAEMAAGFQVLLMAEGGKSLPAEGFGLPLLAGANAFYSEELTVNHTGETLASATQQQLSGGVDAAAATVIPELNVQGFVVGNVATEVGLAGFNPASANQAALVASSAPLAGLQIMGMGHKGSGFKGEGLNAAGQRVEGQKGQSSFTAFNTSTAASTATAVLPTELDTDVANKPVTGLVANSSITTRPSAELTGQLQASLTQSSALAVEPTSGGAATESVSSFNTLLTTETPQAHRANAQASIQATVPVEVGKPGWSDTVMQRVMWMSSQQINKAEIALDPPELGPLQVRISTNGDQTTVSFTSQHGTVRDALDQGLPRLREMMDNQGLNLADVDVSDQHQQQQSQAQAQAQENNNGEAALTDTSVDIDDVNVDQQTNLAQPSEMKPLSLIDQYV